jgi:hypothetical protein
MPGCRGRYHSVPDGPRQAAGEGRASAFGKAAACHPERSRRRRRPFDQAQGRGISGSREPSGGPRSLHFATLRVASVGMTTLQQPYELPWGECSEQQAVQGEESLLLVLRSMTGKRDESACPAHAAWWPMVEPDRVQLRVRAHREIDESHQRRAAETPADDRHLSRVHRDVQRVEQERFANGLE